jgi:hypothetical protein
MGANVAPKNALTPLGRFFGAVSAHWQADRRSRHALAVGLIALAAGSCTGRSVACQSPPDCDEGHECLAFRCVPAGGNPVPATSERRLLLPESVGGEGDDELGATIDLGPPHNGGLYVEFDLPNASCKRLDSAFLLLDPGHSTQPTPNAVEVTVRRVRESWSPRSLGDGQTPEDGVPEARGFVAPPLTARIDVTRVVCNALETAEPNHGLVVRSDVDVPLRIATGTDSASPPRLELYLLATEDRESSESPKTELPTAEP